MASNYYALVAGLREFAIDTEKKGFEAPAIIDEIRSQLTAKDRECLDLFYNFYDIGNIIDISSGRSRFSELGTFTASELADEIKNPQNLPDYLAPVVEAYADPDNTDFEDIDHSKSFERSLFDAYYRQTSKAKCRFIRDWYEFDRNLRNTLAAYGARKGGLTIADQLVGEGYVADSLSRSSAADFGLKGELDYIDDIISALNEEPNLLEKERKIDMIRWRMADELTPFDYFNMNTILAYLAKINIIHRWVTLDENYGREMFNKLMASLAGSDLIGKAEQEMEK